MLRLHEQLFESFDGALDCSEAAKENPPQALATRVARDDCFEHNFALDVHTPQGPQLDDALTFSGFDGYSSIALTQGEPEADFQTVKNIVSGSRCFCYPSMQYAYTPHGHEDR